MIVIYAEKPDMGTKIAAALDGLQIGGRRIAFKDIEKNTAAIKGQRSKDGCFHITYRGQDTIVTWGYGHMCELKQASDINPDWKNWRNLPLPFIPDSYDLKLMESAHAQFKLLKKWFNEAEEIICATDNDREGDLIFDYLYTYMKCRTPYKRAIFNKQAEAEFIKAFDSKNLIDSKKRMSIIYAGRARSAGDFIVGAGPTVAMTLKYGKPGEILSVGRVQTATLNMIIERERSIRSFKPEDYYVLEGQFITKNKEQYKGTHKSKRFKDKKEAEKILSRIKSSKGNVEEVKREESKKSKPYLYSLATLQMTANKVYGYSLDKTLELAQSLYDGGYTTYPRTDSNFLTDDAGNEIRDSLDMHYRIYGVSPEIPFDGKNKHYFDSSKVVSHYAIVTTTKEPVSLKTDEQNIYDLIAKSVLCITAKEATVAKVTVQTNVDGELFETTGNIIVEPGFYALTGYPKENHVPNVRKGDEVGAKISLVTKQTEPPKRYTDATLLAAMINCGKTLENEELKAFMSGGPDEKPKGLGRPSSQASIVKTLEDRKYITKVKKTIYPTDQGFLLIDSLPVTDLKSAEMTAKWELRLDNIEKGKDNYADFMKDLEESVKKWTEEIKGKEWTVRMETESNYLCPVCGNGMKTLRWGYVCEDKDNCGFSVGFVAAGTTIPKEEIDKLMAGGETKQMEFQNKEGKPFRAKIKVNKEKKKAEFIFSDEFSGYKCPSCKKGLLVRSWGYECSDKVGCGFRLGTKIAEKNISETQIKKLLETGESDFIKGFKSKSGKTFDAKLQYDKEMRQIKFVFEEMKSEESGYKCPLCKRPLKHLTWGYVCDKEAGCEFTLGSKICKKTLSDSQIKKLLKFEEVEVKGMISQKGNKFDARLKLNDSGKIDFLF